jgi:circadian clock protein KaiB
VAAKRKDLPSSRNPATWDLRLYVADKSPRFIRAFDNLKTVCETRLSGRYHIEVIDVLTHPEIARTDQIVALPTLIRRNPKPLRTGIGDLTNSGRLLEILSLN